MNTYIMRVAFTILFADPSAQSGDGIRRLHKFAEGDIEAKSKHDAWRKFRRQMDTTWPVRWGHEIKYAKIVKKEA